jgi:hypothetical protein
LSGNYRIQTHRNHHIYPKIKATVHRRVARPTPTLLNWAAFDVVVVCVPESEDVEVLDDDDLPPVPVEPCRDAPEDEALVTSMPETDVVPEAGDRTLSALEADEPEVKDTTPLVFEPGVSGYTVEDMALPLDAGVSTVVDVAPSALQI